MRAVHHASKVDANDHTWLALANGKSGPVRVGAGQWEGVSYRSLVTQ